MTKEEYKQAVKDMTIAMSKSLEPVDAWCSPEFKEDYEKAIKQHYDKYIANLYDEEL